VVCLIKTSVFSALHFPEIIIALHIYANMPVTNLHISTRPRAGLRFKVGISIEEALAATG